MNALSQAHESHKEGADSHATSNFVVPKENVEGGEQAKNQIDDRLSKDSKKLLNMIRMT